MNIKNFSRKVAIAFLSVLVLTMVQCASKSPDIDPTKLPKDILGVELGMTKDEAEKHLNEVAVFKADAEKRQQIWTVRDKRNFDSVAVGYNRDGKIRFVTAFAEKDKVTEPLRFDEVGEISKAAAEITKPHHRYTWRVEQTADKPEYIVTIYGADPEFLSTYSISEVGSDEEKKE